MSSKSGKASDKPFTQRQQRIYDFLSANQVGVLATVDPNGEPHGAVIYFSIDKDFMVTFLTKSGTKKYDNLTRNNHAVLVVFDPVTQTVAQLVGKAVEITDTNNINAIAAAVFKVSLKSSAHGTLPITKLEAGEYAAFQIQPVQIRMARYGQLDSGDYRELFESIESFELRAV